VLVDGSISVIKGEDDTLFLRTGMADSLTQRKRGETGGEQGFDLEGELARGDPGDGEVKLRFNHMIG